MSKRVSLSSEMDSIPKSDTPLISLSYGVQVKPIQYIPEVMTSSASNNSSIEDSPTHDLVPLESSTLSQKKKKKKKSKKPKALDATDSLSGKPRIPPSPDFERASVLCISRNKHWKYISSYHVISLPTSLRRPN